MQIVVLANESLKEELLCNGVLPAANVNWILHYNDFLNFTNADACIDLLFENKKERLEVLNKITCSVIINSVEYTLQETNPNFIRINGWPTFLKSSLVEAAASNEAKQKAENVLAQFNKKIEWLPDVPGFITPRVISAIINEAYTSLEEEVSSKEQIDTAMKLGTNYPYGPFEWAEKIGFDKIVRLLEKLSQSQSRYLPSSLLSKQTR